MVKILIKKVLFIQKIKFKINKIHGKQLSYNNYNDIFSALTISKSLPKNTGTV
jgi:phosphoribosylaminoimidazolecarboxamide formyltransferase/IMP cyclohydrolase